MFVTVDLAAHAADIPVPRLRVWAVKYRDRITVACDLRTRRTVYCLADVMQLERDTRARRASQMRDKSNREGNINGTATHA